ncbi:MAG: acyl carrier protein [Myxococcota bacterium]
MTRDDILEELRALIQRHLDGPVNADLETDIQRDLELDSMKKLALIVEIENRFRLSFEPEDDLQTQTVGDLVSVIERHLDGNSR